MSAFALSQILAGMTLITGMAAFQFKERKHILRGWFVAAVFAAIHFYLLGSTEACLLVSVTALRMLVSSFTTDSRMMWLFLTLAIAGFVLTFENPVSLLGMAATICGTVGAFHGSEKAVRYSLLVTEVLWAIHNIIVWSPVGVAMEVLFFASNVVGLIRRRKAAESAL
jgi:hypothetical protein